MKFLKMISLMLTLAFIVGAIAPVYAASVHEDINRAFAKYNYAMNVEWDQENAAFVDLAEMELKRSMEKVDADTLMAYMVNSISDFGAREEFIRLVKAMKAQNLSEKEAASVAAAWAEKASASGVNFMGQGGGFQCKLVCKVIIVGVVVIVVHQLLKKDEPHKEEYHHHHD